MRSYDTGADHRPIHVGPDPPLAPVEGMGWHDTGAGADKRYINGAWTLTGTAGTDIVFFADAAESAIGATGVTSVSATYTALGSDEVILCNGTFTVTLPAASGNEGKEYRIKNIGTGAITIDGSGAETVDDTTTKVLASQYDAAEIVCDGSEWFIL